MKRILRSDWLPVRAGWVAKFIRYLLTSCLNAGIVLAFFFCVLLTDIPAAILSSHLVNNRILLLCTVFKTFLRINTDEQIYSNSRLFMTCDRILFLWAGSAVIWRNESTVNLGNPFFVNALLLYAHGKVFLTWISKEDAPHTEVLCTA